MAGQHDNYSYQITGFGADDSLKKAFGPKPDVSEGFVRIRVRYAGLNFADIMQRKGVYPGIQDAGLPYTPGMEVVGDVDAVGPGVPGLAVGDRVFAKLEMGGYAAYVVAPISHVFAVPGSIEDKEVLGLVGTSGQTAYGLAKSLKSSDGRPVFITAAAGGVGSILIQLCKHAGRTVIAGVGNEDKAWHTAKLGADQTVRYDREGWEKTLLDFAGEAGLAAAIDSVGGAPNRGALAALGNWAELVFFGGASGDLVGLPPDLVFPFVAGCNSIRGFGLIGYYLSGPNVLTETIQGLFQARVNGAISHITTTVFPSYEIEEAHWSLGSRQSMGKLLLDMHE
ncbi:MAG: zinc-binding dehydrogenase [Pseudomonadota bacterium]